MASSYPTTLDSFATTRADATAMATIQKDDHNNYADAINKIEIELGLIPSGAAATVAARIIELSTLVPASTTALTAYTFVLGDAGTVKEFTAATAVTATVPTNASVAYPIGTMLGILQYGAGQVTLAGAGVTILSPGSKFKTALQYSSAWLRKRATDEWVFSGDITA